MVKNDFYYDPQSQILFMKGKNGYYEPLAIEYNIDSGEGKIIAEDKMLMEFYQFVNYFQRNRDNKGKYRSNPIFPYQWSFLFRHVVALVNGTGESMLESYARQLTTFKTGCL